MRDDGVTVRVHYNNSHLPPGKVDDGRHHYLNTRGRLRPDVTLTFERDDSRFSAVVVECKHSDDPDVLARGYHEAHLYLAEYEAHLKSQPKAILVTSASIPGEIRADHDVVAEGWAGWPSPVLLRQLVDVACQ
jgi:hypothetical protein